MVSISLIYQAAYDPFFPPNAAELDQRPHSCPSYPTGLYVGNRVFSSSMAKRQLIQILILGKNPPNHSLCLSPQEAAAAVLLTGWGYFLRARGHEDDWP